MAGDNDEQTFLEHHEQDAPPRPPAPESFSDLLSRFESLFSRVDVTEHDLHDFMVQNTEVLPTPLLLGHDLQWNAVISKFALDRTNIPDFTYITKNSGQWRIVFVEIERPQKRLFIDKPHVDFHSDTRQAISQIEGWKSFIERNSAEVLRKLEMLMRPEAMRRNPIEFQYVLVIGRNKSGIYPTTEHSGRIKRLFEESKIHLCTYDSLCRMTTRSGIGSSKNVLVESGSGFKFKTAQADTNIFAYFTPYEIALDEEQARFFIDKEYEIHEWRDGKKLILNYKYAEGPNGERFSRLFNETAWRARGTPPLDDDQPQ